jgi:hypothetical protein
VCMNKYIEMLEVMKFHRGQWWLVWKKISVWVVEVHGNCYWQIETHLFGNSGDMASTVCQGEKLWNPYWCGILSYLYSTCEGYLCKKLYWRGVGGRLRCTYWFCVRPWWPTKKVWRDMIQHLCNFPCLRVGVIR